MQVSAAVALNSKHLGSLTKSDGANLLIVSDSSLFRNGLAKALTGWPFQRIDGSGFADGAEFDRANCDMVLLEVGGDTPSDALRDRISWFWGTPLVILNDHFSFDLYVTSLQSQVQGYLLSDMEIAAMRTSLLLILNGRTVFPTEAALARIFATNHASAGELFYGNRPVPSFSRQEVRILKFLVNGESNKMIARRLGNAEDTVKVQMKTLLRKLRLQNRTQAAVWAVKNGFETNAEGPLNDR